MCKKPHPLFSPALSALADAAADFAARAATESASSQENCGSSNDCDGYVQQLTLKSIAEQPSLASITEQHSSIILEAGSESFGSDLRQWPRGVQGAAASVSDPASLPGSVSALADAAADFAAPGRAATESAFKPRELWQQQRLRRICAAIDTGEHRRAALVGT